MFFSVHTIICCLYYFNRLLIGPWALILAAPPATHFPHWVITLITLKCIFHHILLRDYSASEALPWLQDKFQALHHIPQGPPWPAAGLLWPSHSRLHKARKWPELPQTRLLFFALLPPAWSFSCLPLAFLESYSVSKLDSLWNLRLSPPHQVPLPGLHAAPVHACTLTCLSTLLFFTHLFFNVCTSL